MKGKRDVIISLPSRLLAAFAAVAVLSACGGGARSTSTDKVGTTSVATAPAMPEGRPAVAPSGVMQPENGTPAQPIPNNLNCPADEIVWVNTSKHVYHYANDQYYGRTKHGTYMCERDAEREHDRAAGAKKNAGSMMMQGSGKHHRRSSGSAAASPEPQETY